MAGPVTVKFKLTPGEYARAMRQNLLQQPRYLLLGAAGLFTMSAPLWILLLGGNPWRPIPVACALISVVLLIRWFGTGPAAAYRRLNPANRDSDQEFRFMEEGVDVRDATGEGKLDWKAWMKFRETRQFFLLYPAARLVMLIPKRAFTGQEQIAEFRELLKRKLPAA